MSLPSSTLLECLPQPGEALPGLKHLRPYLGQVLGEAGEQWAEELLAVLPELPPDGSPEDLLLRTFIQEELASPLEGRLYLGVLQVGGGQEDIWHLYNLGCFHEAYSAGTFPQGVRSLLFTLITLKTLSLLGLPACRSLTRSLDNQEQLLTLKAWHHLLRNDGKLLREYADKPFSWWHPLVNGAYPPLVNWEYLP